MLTGLSALASNSALGRCSVPELFTTAWVDKSPTPGNADFPRRDDFVIEDGYSYLNAAYTHPIPKVSLEAARQAAMGRCSLPPPAPPRSNPAPPVSAAQPNAASANPKSLFAKLINARPSEIAFVSSTSAGENLVVQALGLNQNFDGNVVTDGLHFEGALAHLLERKKRGLDVRIVKPNDDGRVDLKDFERVVDKKTKLIEVSSASMYNGFQHDLKSVCELAHAHGAFVYADIIHSAGAEPFDVQTLGVDFAACSTFKWLMGDFGIGFLYAREATMDKIRRPVVGYYQASKIEQFFPPFLPEGEFTPLAYELERSASGMFETGTLAAKVAINTALLTASLSYIQNLGLANIQAHRQPLIRKLQQEVPRLGFTPMTPAESTSGIVTFAKQGVGQSELPRKLEAAKVNVRVAANWLRISPSVYNDMADVDRFLEAIS
jgi:selenocysteine lyase/cysteine desulfurase